MKTIEGLTTIGTLLLHFLVSSAALEVTTPVTEYWGSDGDTELVIRANVTAEAGWSDVTVTVTTPGLGDLPATTDDTDENSPWRIYTYTIRSLFIEDAGTYVFTAASTGSGESDDSTIMVYIYTIEILSSESSYYAVERTKQLTISAYVKAEGDWRDVVVAVSAPNGDSIPTIFKNASVSFWRFYAATIDNVTQGNFNFTASETLAGRTHTVISSASVEVSETTEVDEYLYRIGETSASITSSIPTFYSYLYDGPDNTYILDGGQDLYDRGNYITFTAGDVEEQNVGYGKPYFDADYTFSSIKTYPFTSLMWISNADGAKDLFSLEVAGQTGAAETGNTMTFNATIDVSSYSVHYRAMQVYNVAPDPSICEVYFYITNNNLWSSTEPGSAELQIGGSPPTSLENTFAVTGAPKNIMMGYMLLSSSDGKETAESAVVDVLKKTTAVFQEKDAFVLSPGSENVAVGPEEDSVTLTARVTNIGDWADIKVEILTPMDVVEVLDQYTEDGDERIYKYTINSITEQDSGIYSFLATDGFDYQLQAKTVLSVYSADILVETPEYYASNGDEELVISVVVTANDWNGTIVLVKLPDGSVVEAVTESTNDSAREYTHTVKNLFIEDAGDYFFSTERNGMVSSASKSVTVYLFTISVYPEGFVSYKTEKEKRAEFIVYAICDGDWNNVEGTLTYPGGKQYSMTSVPGQSPQIRIFNATISDAIGGEYNISVTETLQGRTETKSIKHTIEVQATNYVDEYLYRIGLLTDELVSYVPGWEYYYYDGVDSTYIMDGGFDMYDRGNYISYAWSSGEELNVPYGVPMENNVTIFSTKNFYPFVSLMWISNQNQSEEEFSLTVTSRGGAASSSPFETYRRVLFEGTYEVTYHVFQVYGSTKPSICEAYFMITNTYEWQSVAPDSFNLEVGGTPPQDLINTAKVTGSPSNIMLGYTLLSMGNGAQVSYFEVEKVIERYVAVIAQRDQFAIKPTTSDGYYAAVSGENATVEAMVTTNGDWDGVSVEVELPSGAKQTVADYQFTNLHTQRVYTYTINNVKYSNAGDYKFIATDRFGEQKETTSQLYVFTHKSSASTTQYVGGLGDTVTMEIFIKSDTYLFTVEIDTPTLGTQDVTNFSEDSTGMRTYRYIIEDIDYEQDNGDYTFRVTEVFGEYTYVSTVDVNLAVLSVSTSTVEESYTADAGSETLNMLIQVHTFGDWENVAVKVNTPRRGTAIVNEYDLTNDETRRNYVFAIKNVVTGDAGNYVFVATETLLEEEEVSESTVRLVVKATEEPKSNLSGGEIAGIVIGCVAGVAIIGGLVWYCTKQRNTASDKSSPKSPPTYDDATVLENKKTEEKEEDTNYTSF